MFNPNIVMIRTYTIKRAGAIILETTDEYKMLELVKDYKTLPACGYDRQESFPRWQASNDTLEVISTGNYASMGGFIIQYFK